MVKEDNKIREERVKSANWTRVEEGGREKCQGYEKSRILKPGEKQEILSPFSLPTHLFPN